MPSQEASVSNSLAAKLRNFDDTSKFLLNFFQCKTFFNISVKSVNLFALLKFSLYLCIVKLKQITIMKKNEILDFIKTMAKSQGFYGSLLNAINEDNSILDALEEQNFKDPIELVIYLED